MMLMEFIRVFGVVLVGPLSIVITTLIVVSIGTVIAIIVALLGKCR